MTQSAALKLEIEDLPDPSLRMEIATRLADIVSWPGTRIISSERQLAGDILIGLLKTAPVELRRRCAARLAGVVDAPKPVLRYLARDEIGVAQALLDQSPALDDSDLIATIRAGSPAHWLAIARRRNIAEVVTEQLCATLHFEVVEAALRNGTARFSVIGIDSAVRLSREGRGLIAPLIRREELKPAQGLTMFWWSDPEHRQALMRRFGVDRMVLIERLGDLFPLGAKLGWADPEARKALQLVERRQRNRDAAVKSPYGSLEGAIEAALERGLDRALVTEIAHLAGIRPRVAARMLSDPGGEPIAILCKATGVKRHGLEQLWRALRRPMADGAGAQSPWARTTLTFDVVATSKAQTILRYWNWALTADEAPPGPAEDAADEFAPARRISNLLRDLKS
jgi:uncharacterized protein (DUF2336 family)